MFWFYLLYKRSTPNSAGRIFFQALLEGEIILPRSLANATSLANAAAVRRRCTSQIEARSNNILLVMNFSHLASDTLSP